MHPRTVFGYSKLQIPTAAPIPSTAFARTKRPLLVVEADESLMAIEGG